MIFDIDNTPSTIFEGMVDEFSHDTIEEASAILLAEQEENWTRLMKAVGMSELTSVIEGEEVVYEGGRLESFKNAVIKFFNSVIEKLKKITVSFIEKVKKLDPVNKAFLKAFEGKLKKAKETLPADYKLSMQGFSAELDKTPEYKDPESVRRSVEDAEGQNIKKAAENAVFSGGEGDSFKKRVHSHLFGEKNTVKVDVDEQISIIANTHTMKNQATAAYKNAEKEVKTMIKVSKAMKSGADDEGKKVMNETISFFKAYSTALTAYHHEFLSALGKRNSQAKRVCLTVLKDTAKKKKSESSEKKPTNEGFVTTDAFLGAIEFI